MAMFAAGEILVQKFGGSSLASPDRIFKVAERIAEQAAGGRRLAVVVSAMGDTTDDLLALQAKISSDPDPRESDLLSATGELVSCSLVATALRRLGCQARSFHAVNLRLMTDERFGSAEIRGFERLRILEEWLAAGGVAVVAGFQGLTPAGDLTTLGRGGSDITAVALARELNQRVCEKFTDEDGIYSADPRLVPLARKVWHLDYDEMETLARYGNGILHPRAIAYARDGGIRIHVRSSFTREEGSVIGPDGDPTLAVKSLALDRKQAMVSIEGVKRPEEPFPIGVGEDPFPVLEREWRSEDGQRGSIRIGFRTADAFQAMRALWQEADRLGADEVRFTGRLAVITMVGCGLSEDSGLGSRFLERLRGQTVEPLLVERHGIRFSVAVSDDQARPAMEALHEVLTGHA